MPPRLEPWYRVVPPRDDLLAAGPGLDASTSLGDLETGPDLAAAVRRLFAWDDVGAEGRRAARAYAQWAGDQRDPALEQRLLASYPLHPALLAFFEPVWHRRSSRPAVLRLLAMWADRAYAAAVRGAQKDPLLGPDSAPLDDPAFRSALLDLSGRPELAAAIAADVAGTGCHAARLDRQAPDDLRLARVHRRVAATICMYSIAEPAGAERRQVIAAVATPDLRADQVEAALDAVVGACHYLDVSGERYRFVPVLNLMSALAERRAGVEAHAAEARARAAVRVCFEAGSAWDDRVIFPTASQDVPDRPALTLVVLGPDQPRGGPAGSATLAFVDRLLREHGAAHRLARRALLILAPDDPNAMLEAARTLLAWEEIARSDAPPAGDGQWPDVEDGIASAHAALQAAVGAAYRWVLVLDSANARADLDLGPLACDQDRSLGEQVRDRLIAAGTIVADIDPAVLLPHWPPHREWSTRAVRDAFYALPALPRPLHAGAILGAIARGVAEGLLGYVVRDDEEGQPVRVRVDTTLEPGELRFGADTVIVHAADARARYPLGAAPAAPTREPSSLSSAEGEGPLARTATLRWEGNVAPEIYADLGARVLARLAAIPGLAIRVRFDVPAAALSEHDLEQLRAALRDIGLDGAALR